MASARALPSLRLRRLFDHRPMAPADEVVLVTGYPGIVARRLVEHLLVSEPETRIRAVVLERMFARAAHHLERFPPEVRSRVRVMGGDAAAMDFGLSGRELRELASEVVRMHHAAYVSYVGVEREVAEQNVRGAVEAVHVARLCKKLRCLVHYSTAEISGDREGLVRESELDEGQGHFTRVQETRMKAELVMRRAMVDLPIAVVRPTNLVGDSDTGEIDRLDGLYLLVLLVLGLPGEVAVPLPTGGDYPLDVVPVDFVVRAAHAISVSPLAPGGTFHLTSSESLTAQAVFDAIARAGGRRTSRSLMPPKLAATIARVPGIGRILREPGALIQQLATNARYDTRQARKLLEPAGIVCPPFDSYVATLVAAVQERFRERDG
ncbi:MAG: NAD-dependent epimerase/dehydratase family protein [Myxococcales bacterium]|nr:NAD-dependent epimerase/dehydratase family protein [Myxococcales bacterium]